MSTAATLSAAARSRPDAMSTISSYRLDPRTHLAAFLSVAVWVSTTHGLPALSAWVAGLSALLIALRIKPRFQSVAITPLLMWVSTAGLLTIGFYSAFGPDNGGDGATILGLRVAYDSLWLGLAMALRLTALVFLSLALVAALPPLDMAAGMTRLFLPLSRIGVPVTNFFYLTFFLAQMIPSLIQESRLIRMAQRSRGIGVDKDLIARWRVYPSLVVPVFLSALRRGDMMALVLASRGFDSERVPVRVRRLRFSIVDLLLLAALTAGWALWAYSRMS